MLTECFLETFKTVCLWCSFRKATKNTDILVANDDAFESHDCKRDLFLSTRVLVLQINSTLLRMCIFAIKLAQQKILGTSEC